MVEVGHDDLETLVFGTEEVRLGHLDVVELDVGRARSGRVRRLDGLGVDVLIALHQQHRVALVALARHHKVIAEDTVGDPLLGAVDNVMRAVLAELCRCPQARDVGARKRLRHG